MRRLRDICSRLDGLRLAIELATVRVKLLPLAAIHARLHQRLLLTVVVDQAVHRLVRRMPGTAIVRCYARRDRESDSVGNRARGLSGPKSKRSERRTSILGCGCLPGKSVESSDRTDAVTRVQ
jgi:hypothetical protein